MNRFRRSRGRVSVEILCALTISLSLAGAWLQTGAWALLPASLAALICSMTLAADLKGGEKVPAAEPQRIDFDPGPAKGAAEPAGDMPAALEEPAALLSDEEAAPKARAPRAKVTSRSKKAGSKKAGTAGTAGQEAKSPPPVSEPNVAAGPMPQGPEEATQLFTEEPQHPPVAPLFEPEPFVRQQRAVFGRKAG